MPLNPIDLSRAGAPHVGSYWAVTAGDEVSGVVPVTEDLDVDIAIIGGGYTGLSTAYHLARDHGVAAHVLEANRIGWGCSGRNGGFCSIGIGKEDFETWVRRWGIDQARTVFEMGREAVRTVRGLVTDEGFDVEMTPEGGLELAHKANRMPGFATRSQMLHDLFGVETRLLDRAALERDYLVSREAHGALLYSEGFALHAMRYVRGLAEAAQRRGAVLHGSSPVTEWRRDGERHLLVTPRGTVRARQVVIATNGYTNDSLHPRTNGRLLPVLSNIIVTRPLTAAERESVNWQTYLKIWDSRRLLFYYRLLPDNRVLFGARGGIHDTPTANRKQKAWLQRRFADMFPPLSGVDTDFFWRGWVCASYDKNPHLGTTDDPTVHYALAYLGTGVALSTLCGRLLATRLGGGAVDAGPLLSQPLPPFPFPRFRRLYQRAAYSYYALQDRLL
ncbi:FAD-dependent oxidoreductase [Rhodospirillaceae bacterium SYSU D60014]|uniref:NAD(P)/FAD-dependent oxidoreductase n=1 Tax=Virgifigura deserti TaxID=2268457 RepID=UPI000E66E991